MPNSDLQKSIGQWVASTYAVGIAGFFLMFLTQASSLSSASETTSRVIGVGPVHLLRVTKTIQTAGASVSFEFLPGLITFGVTLFVVAILGAWIASKRESHMAHS